MVRGGARHIPDKVTCGLFGENIIFLPHVKTVQTSSHRSLNVKTRSTVLYPVNGFSKELIAITDVSKHTYKVKITFTQCQEYFINSRKNLI
jgi:hypothetical protein